MRPDEEIFDRVQEQEELRARLEQRRSFLLHGPAGAGKSLLLQAICGKTPGLIYCRSAASMHGICQEIALFLARNKNPVLSRKVGQHAIAGLKSTTAVSLRGLVRDALMVQQYQLVLDHFRFASRQVASMLKEWKDASTAIVIVARSRHMEQIGYAAPFFPERKDRFLLDNFNADTARKFADWIVQKQELEAANVQEFKARMVELTQGNPAMMKKLVELAALPKYRSGEHIKVTPLYLDVKLCGNAVEGHEHDSTR